jgi:5'-nucleotidase
VTPDPGVAKIVAAAQREIGPQVNRVVATFADTVRRTTGDLGNLMADAFRMATGAQLAFVNNGSIRIAEIPAGPVTWGTLYSLQPFENRMVKLSMTGAQIREVAEHAVADSTPDMHVSGVTVIYNKVAPKGQRVERMTLADGQDITEAATYTVAVTDFLALGTGDGYHAFGAASKREDSSITDLDAVIRYLEQLPKTAKLANGEVRFQPSN